MQNNKSNKMNNLQNQITITTSKLEKKSTKKTKYTQPMYCCVNLTSQEYICYKNNTMLNKYKNDLYIEDEDGDTRWNNNDVLKYINCNTPLFSKYVDIYYSRIVL